MYQDLSNISCLLTDKNGDVWHPACPLLPSPTEKYFSQEHLPLFPWRLGELWLGFSRSEEGEHRSALSVLQAIGLHNDFVVRPPVNVWWETFLMGLLPCSSLASGCHVSWRYAFAPGLSAWRPSHFSCILKGKGTAAFWEEPDRVDGPGDVRKKRYYIVLVLWYDQGLHRRAGCH